MKPKRTIDALLGASIVFFLAAVPVDLGLAQQIPHWHKECRNGLKQFKTKPKHKAFAVTSMSQSGVSGIACGSAWGYPSKAAAEAAAIRACEKNARPCSVTRSE
jgi:hypothetical protein